MKPGFVSFLFKGQARAQCHNTLGSALSQHAVPGRLYYAPPAVREVEVRQTSGDNIVKTTMKTAKTCIRTTDLSSRKGSKSLALVDLQPLLVNVNLKTPHYLPVSAKDQIS